MDNQSFFIASIFLCSLAGWYVVITKYLVLKKMVKDHNNELPPHIPGMGPPPVTNIPFTIPEEFLEPEAPYLYEDPMEAPPSPMQSAPMQAAQMAATSDPKPDPTPATEKRLICNQTCILHLIGFSIIFGVPFLNVLLPTLFWLWKKEQHPYLAKQGREVINFQITYSLIQFICLGGGVLFIRYMPEYAAKLFAFAKITRIVFSSGMYLPFNVFTVLPFFWCCIVMIRGAVAAYHGVSYKYPGTQQFLFAGNNPPAKNSAPRSPIAPTPARAPKSRMSFG